MSLTTSSPEVSVGPVEPDETSQAHSTPSGPVTVTAVVVAHDGARWLPRGLDALSAQTRAPDRVLAADTGSTDGSSDLLAAALGADHVRSLGRTTGFGAAVRAALDALPPLPGTEWLWLLHDDCAPEPGALAALVDAVRRSPSIGVAGPKLVDWDDADRLLEVGLTASRGGRRVTEVEPGEHDQGQKDHRHDVLAVGTAGMLVRRDVWDRLGGLDPALPLFRDDVDFGWRAQLSGARVVVVPSARVADAQAATRGLRSVDAVRGVPRRVDRTHGLQVALAGAPLLWTPFLLLWFAVGGLLRSVGLLVAKAPRRSWDELVSVSAAVLTPWRVVGARWRARGTRQVPRRDIARLLAPRRSAFRGLAESFSGSLGQAREGRVEVLDGLSLESGPTAEESENAVRVTSRMTRRILTNPGLLVLLVALAFAIGFARRLLGHGTLAGGQLLTYTGSARAVWHSYVDGWQGTGLGPSSPPAPYRAVVAALAYLLEPVSSHPAALAVDVLLIGAIPLSAFSAYVAGRRILASRWVCAWAALTWATLPTVTGALAVGRVGASVVHILLPLVLLGFGRALRRPGSSTAAFAGGLALAVAAAFAPVLLGPAAVVALVALVLGGWGRRARALLLMAVPAVLLLPWLPTLADNPRLLLAGPGLLGPVGGGGASAYELALLHPGGPGAAYVVLGVPLVAAGLAGLLRRGGSWLLSACGLLVVLGLALALAGPHVVLATTASGPQAAWAGTGVDLMAVALLVAALHGVDGLAGRLAHHRFGWRQVVLGPLAVLAVAATVASMTFLLLEPARGPVHRTLAGELPAVAVDQAEGAAGTRTLVLTGGSPGSGGATSGPTTYRLVGAELGDAARTLPGWGADPLTAAAAAAVVSPPPDTSVAAAVTELQRLGIAFVVVTRPVPDALEQRLDTTVGLTRLGESGTYALWRVQLSARTSPARVRVVDSSGRVLQDVTVLGPQAAVDTALPPGTAGRQLVLAEPVATAWRATLSGVALRAGSSGGLQTFDLPATGGRLVVSAQDGRHRLLLVQGGALVVVILLALPLGRRRRSEAEHP